MSDDFVELIHIALPFGHNGNARVMRLVAYCLWPGPESRRQAFSGPSFFVTSVEDFSVRAAAFFSPTTAQLSAHVEVLASLIRS